MTHDRKRMATELINLVTSERSHNLNKPWYPCLFSIRDRSVWEIVSNIK